MGGIQSLNGRLATAEHLNILVNQAPEYINSASCIFNSSELNALSFYLATVKRFMISSGKPGSLVNKIGGLEDLFILTLLAVSSDNLIDAQFIEVFGENITSATEADVKGFIAYALLVSLLKTGTDDQTAFSSFITRGLLSTNIVRQYLVKNLNGNIQALRIFLSALEKIFFANNTNLTLGLNNMVIVSAPTILVQGTLQQVLLGDCNKTSSNLGECIFPTNAGVRINCGVYVNRSNEQTILKTPANVDTSLNGIYSLIGAKAPFRSATIRKRFLNNKCVARQDVFAATNLDMNVSCDESIQDSCESECSSDESFCGDILDDYPILANRIPTYVSPSNVCGKSSCSSCKGSSSSQVKTKGSDSTESNCKLSGSNGRSESNSRLSGSNCKLTESNIRLTESNSKLTKGNIKQLNKDKGDKEKKRTYDTKGNGKGNKNKGRCSSSSSSSSSSCEDDSMKIFSTKMYNGSIMQYLRSIQGTLRIMSFKINSLIRERNDCGLIEDNYIQTTEALGEVTCDPTVNIARRPIFVEGDFIIS